MQAARRILTILTKSAAGTLSFLLGTFSTSDARGGIALIALKNVVLSRLKVIKDEFLLFSFFRIRAVRFLKTEMFPYVVFSTTGTLPLTTGMKFGVTFGS